MNIDREHGPRTGRNARGQSIHEGKNIPRPGPVLRRWILLSKCMRGCSECYEIVACLYSKSWAEQLYRYVGRWAPKTSTICSPNWPTSSSDEHARCYGPYWRIVRAKVGRWHCGQSVLSKFLEHMDFLPCEIRWLRKATLI